MCSLEVSTPCCKNQKSPSNVNDHVFGFFCRCIFRGNEFGDKHIALPVATLQLQPVFCQLNAILAAGNVVVILVVSYLPQL